PHLVAVHHRAEHEVRVVATAVVVEGARVGERAGGGQGVEGVEPVGQRHRDLLEPTGLTRRGPAGAAVTILARSRPGLVSGFVEVPVTTRRPLLSDRYDDGVFRLGREHGLLPKAPPLERLPARFDALQAILD